jgi:hypothetical protein
MSRSAVGLLAAVGAAMSALVGLTHGDLACSMVLIAAVATGLAAYLAASPIKKKFWDDTGSPARRARSRTEGSREALVC